MLRKGDKYMYKNEVVNNINTFFEFYKFIEKMKKQFPDAEWDDSFSVGQIESKLWLIDNLKTLNLKLGKTFIYGGWYAILAKLMFEVCLDVEYIRSFDFDLSCHKIAETINRSQVMNDWQFKATTLDIFDITYPVTYDTLRRNGSICKFTEIPNTIINTSCEHMYLYWYNKVPNNTLMILQSNNFTAIEEHTHCVNGLDDMKRSYPMTQIYYEGELNLQDYTRFMLIGIK